MKVLVTDGDERASLAVVRSLGRMHQVHVCAAGRASLAGCSRFAAQYHRLPDPADSEVDFADGVRQVVSQYEIDVVLPVSDSSHMALLGRQELGAPLLAPSRSAYERLSDKAEVARLAAEVGLGVPRTIEARSLEEALASAQEIGWPVVLKPAHSVVEGAESAGQTKLGVVTAADAGALRALWPQVSEADVVLVQRYVPGHGEGVFALRHQGETIAVFAHRRLREKPPPGGVSVLRESIQAAPERLISVERILDTVGFEGIAMARGWTSRAYWSTH
jgi:predicted ATP-grasp superfamily ATP-dependent carboligase